MSQTADGAILKVLSDALESRSVIDVAAETKQIASLYNVDAAEVARDLTDSGLLAGANMALGTAPIGKTQSGAGIRLAAGEPRPGPRPTTQS